MRVGFNLDILIEHGTLVTVNNNREIIEDGVNGSLVPVGDAQALGARIRETIKHPQLIPIVQKMNFDIIESKYEEKKIMAHSEELYMNLIRTDGTKQEILERVGKN